jgi:hypothetical protein
MWMMKQSHKFYWQHTVLTNTEKSGRERSVERIISERSHKALNNNKIVISPKISW